MSGAGSQRSDWDYRGLAAEAYDLWFGAEPYEDQHFYQQRIAQAGGAALEVACGTGRLLIPYLRDGLQVEGLDSSAAMLAICRQKAAAAGVTPVLYQQFMQEIDVPTRYGTIFIPSCSFQILAQREEAFASLRAFREHLQPGGQLLVSLHVPWDAFRAQSQWRLRRSGTRPSDGATVVIHECTRSDRFAQSQQIWLRLEVWVDGSLKHSELRTHTMRWYHQYEFALMLESCGFTDVMAFSGYRETAASDRDAEVVFAARRRA
jgi:SAM-dependent methyltransferase